MRGVGPLVVGGALVGGLAAVLPSAGLLVLGGVIGLALVVSLIRFRAKAVTDERTWHPVVMVLTGLAVATICWNGFRSGGTSPPDLILIAAFFGVGYCWFQNTIKVPLPGWLLGAAGIMFAVQFLDQFFIVPNPPPDPPPSFTPPGPPIITMLRFELAFLIVPIVIGAVASSWRRANLLANLFVLSAVVSSMIAVVDGFTGAGLGQSITGVIVDNLGNRPAGLTNHPNTFALTCSMTIPIALLRSFQFRGLGRVVAIGAALILIGGILVSGSRVGLVALVVSIFLTSLLLPKLRARVVVIALVGAILTLIVVPNHNPLLEGISRLSGGGDSGLANGQRSSQFSESLHLALGHPVTGIGYQVVADAHSLPLQFWETAGFLGIMALIIYAWGTFHTAWRLYRDPAGLPRGSPQFIGALSISFAVWLLAGLGQNEIADRYIFVPVGLLLGLGIAANEGRKRLNDNGAGTLDALPSGNGAASAPPRTERVPVAS